MSHLIGNKKGKILASTAIIALLLLSSLVVIFTLNIQTVAADPTQNISNGSFEDSWTDWTRSTLAEILVQPGWDSTANAAKIPAGGHAAITQSFSAVHWYDIDAFGFYYQTTGSGDYAGEYSISYSDGTSTLSVLPGASSWTYKNLLPMIAGKDVVGVGIYAFGPQSTIVDGFTLESTARVPVTFTATGMGSADWNSYAAGLATINGLPQSSYRQASNVVYLPSGVEYDIYGEDTIPISSSHAGFLEDTLIDGEYVNSVVASAPTNVTFVYYVDVEEGLTGLSINSPSVPITIYVNDIPKDTPYSAYVTMDTYNFTVAESVIYTAGGTISYTLQDWLVNGVSVGNADPSLVIAINENSTITVDYQMAIVDFASKWLVGGPTLAYDTWNYFSSGSTVTAATLTFVNDDLSTLTTWDLYGNNNPTVVDAGAGHTSVFQYTSDGWAIHNPDADSQIDFGAENRYVHLSYDIRATALPTGVDWALYCGGLVDWEDSSPPRAGLTIQGTVDDQYTINTVAINGDSEAIANLTINTWYTVDIYIDLQVQSIVWKVGDQGVFKMLESTHTYTTADFRYGNLEWQWADANTTGTTIQYDSYKVDNAHIATTYYPNPAYTLNADINLAKTNATYAISLTGDVIGREIASIVTGFGYYMIGTTYVVPLHPDGGYEDPEVPAHDVGAVYKFDSENYTEVIAGTDNLRITGIARGLDTMMISAEYTSYTGDYARGRLYTYDGTTLTQITNDVFGGQVNSYNVRAMLNVGGSNWLFSIVDAQSGAAALYTFDGTDITLLLSDIEGPPVTAMSWNGVYALAGSGTVIFKYQAGELTDFSSDIEISSNCMVADMAWNGTGFLISAPGNPGFTGHVYYFNANTNLTDSIADANFNVLAWNGEYWLLGGDTGAWMLQGSTWTDLSSVISFDVTAIAAPLSTLEVYVQTAPDAPAQVTFDGSTYTTPTIITVSLGGNKLFSAPTELNYQEDHYYFNSTYYMGGTEASTITDASTTVPVISDTTLVVYYDLTPPPVTPTPTPGPNPPGVILPTPTPAEGHEWPPGEEPWWLKIWRLLPWWLWILIVAALIIGTATYINRRRKK